MSLKTSDKAEAKTRALALDMELEMIALRYPRKDAPSTSERLEAVFKEALVYKRDQIADHQSPPPYDHYENRLINAVMGRIYGLIARSGSANISETQWCKAVEDPAMSSEEKALFLTLADAYRICSTQPGPTSASEPHKAGDRVPSMPSARFPVAPRFVLNALSNVDLRDTADNRRIVLATMARAYEQAFQEANEGLAIADADGSHDRLPTAPSELRKSASDYPLAATGPQTNDREAVSSPFSADPQPVHHAPKGAASAKLIDLKLSELTAMLSR